MTGGIKSTGARITQTRLKLVLLSVGIVVACSIAKTIFPQYPLVEVYAALGTINGLYLGVKTTNNIKEPKNDPYV